MANRDRERMQNKIDYYLRVMLKDKYRIEKWWDTKSINFRHQSPRELKIEGREHILLRFLQDIVDEQGWWI